MANTGKRRLEGKVAVVTGAGRGIGREEALLFASEGAKVVVNDLGGDPTGGGGDPSVAQAVVDQIRSAGGDAVIDTTSVSSWEGGKKVVQAAIDAFRRIDILSNNAGIARPARIDQMAEEDWDLLCAVHLKGYISAIRHAAPYFIEQHSGIIVNKSSPSGYGHYAMSAYSACKEGVTGLTRSVARDLGQFGVRCNAVRPITGSSNMGTPALLETLEVSEGLGIPFCWNRWMATPQAVEPTGKHVAAATVWLCTDETANMNGREVFISGAEMGLLPEPQIDRAVFCADGWSLDALENPAIRDYLIGDVRNRFAGNKDNTPKAKPTWIKGL
jgi:3-oxoacyl-[acyl-carrier protein] reductase